MDGIDISPVNDPQSFTVDDGAGAGAGAGADAIVVDRQQPPISFPTV
jgi:hypothetical protein